MARLVLVALSPLAHPFYCRLLSGLPWLSLLAEPGDFGFGLWLSAPCRSRLECPTFSPSGSLVVPIHPLSLLSSLSFRLMRCRFVLCCFMSYDLLHFNVVPSTSRLIPGEQTRHQA